MPVRRTDLLGPAMSKARFDETTGFLHAPVRATRTGVLLYRRKDGTISRELKHPEDVFDAESLESLKRVVLTEGHPRKRDGSPLDVNTDNVEALQVGHAGDSIERETVGKWDHPTLSATVTRKDVVDKILNRRMDQVSMGYTTVLVEESGEYLGVPYDRRHTQIRYNHLAVAIPAGRGGPTVNIRLDEDDAVQLEDSNPEKRKRNRTMLNLTIDGATVSFEDVSLGQIVKSALEKRDAQIDAAKSEAKKKADELDATTAKLDQATKDLEAKTKADEEEPDMASAIVEVLDVVAKADVALGGIDAKGRAELLATEVPEGSTLTATIRKAVVLKACADESEALEKKSDAYLEARFDSLVASGTSTSTQSSENLRNLENAAKGGGSGESRGDEGKDELPTEPKARVDAIMAVGDPLAKITSPHVRTRT